MIELAAVQPVMTLDDYLDVEIFDGHMRALARRVVEARARSKGGGFAHPCVVGFPEHLGTFLGLAGVEAAARARTSEEAMRLAAFAHLRDLLAAAFRGRSLDLKRSLWLALAQRIHRTLYDVFSRLAREMQAYLVAGSAILPRNRFGLRRRFEPLDNRLYNTAYVFSPSGNLIRVVRKVNLVPTMEDVLGLSRGDPHEALPFETAAGRVGVAICYDGFCTAHTPYESFVPMGTFLDEQGAQIVVQPSANPWPWEDPWVFASPQENLLRKDQWLGEGLWASLRGARSIRYGLNPLLHGRFLDLSFDGVSYIFAVEAEGPRIAARADGAAQSEEVVYALLPHPADQTQAPAVG